MNVKNSSEKRPEMDRGSCCRLNGRKDRRDRSITVSTISNMPNSGGAATAVVLASESFLPHSHRKES